MDRDVARDLAWEREQAAHQSAAAAMASVVASMSGGIDDDDGLDARRPEWPTPRPNPLGPHPYRRGADPRRGLAGMMESMGGQGKVVMVVAFMLVLRMWLSVGNDDSVKRLPRTYVKRPSQAMPSFLLKIQRDMNHSQKDFPQALLLTCFGGS